MTNQNFSNMRRKLMTCLSIFPCLPRLAHAGWFSRSDEDMPSIPPARNFKWNLGPKDSFIKQEFTIKEYRGYKFDIGFGSPKSSDDKENQGWRGNQHVWDFIGGSIGAKGQAGVIIPVHIRVEKINAEGAGALVIDQVVNTQSMSAGGDVVTRRIANVRLKPGKYKVIANTLQETNLPEGIGTYLHIGFHPKTTEIKENE